MRHVLLIGVLIIGIMCVPAQGLELATLADCSVALLREIHHSHAWSGKAPDGCRSELAVEKRPAGVFVTAWYGGRSADGWFRLAFSTAMGYGELADRTAVNQGVRDIQQRAARLNRCLDSMLRVNDSLECRNFGKKSYLAGERIGFEESTLLWLDDGGRHSVVEYAVGNTSDADSAPADLMYGPALPPGMKLDLFLLDRN